MGETLTHRTPRLHFVIPRVELSTGKAYNAFPPGWQKDFDSLRDLYNWRENWSRPDDPVRTRFCTPAQADLNQTRLIAGKNYITVKDLENGDKLRLKGGVLQPSGNLANLAERMKQKTEQERKQLENIVKDELTTFMAQGVPGGD